MSDVDVLIAGGGPAGLAAAIRLKQKLNREKRGETVAVIDKAPRAGYHNLSGAVFEAGCLDELVPGWKENQDPFVQGMVKIERDELYYLTAKWAFKVPSFAVPSAMHHEGNHAISVSRLVDWLTRIAEKEGVEIYHGFAGSKLLVEGNRVRGVKLVDLGLDRRGQPKTNYLAGEEIRARATLICDGSRGVLSGQWVQTFGEGKNPQVYSIGVKQLIKLPKDNAFGNNRALHSLGFPSRPNVFGGGFFYSMGSDIVAAGLILGLDWRYEDLNPQQELEILKTHPFIAKLLAGGQVLMAGVKTIPEGGYYAIPPLAADGGLLAGDSAGFVNMEKIKGVHYAVLSGMSAADAVFDAIREDDFSQPFLFERFSNNLETRGLMSEFRHAKNFRQSFRYGLYTGAPLSQIQAFLPFRLGMEKDHLAMRKGALLGRKFRGGMEKSQFTSLSGTTHGEDQPSHIKIKDAALCVTCTKEYGNPCVFFCPGEVYRMKEGEIILSPSNCMHDGSCQVKCPHQNILWTPPEGGEGPRFKQM